jgi:hypothetical protein
MLPPSGGQWPPKVLAPVYTAMSTWSAWYTGDTDRLASAYYSPHAASTQESSFEPRKAQMAGGLIGTVARWFWGQPNTSGQPRAKLHVPLAADIATTSADLLFSEPPKITIDDAATQTRLDQLLEDGMLDALLLEAAEISAALSGVYLRVSWDEDVVPGRPFLTVVHPDAAVPEFAWGLLTAVTFWRTVVTNGDVVWRHLERHEPGKIFHGLYQGSRDDLGRVMPLTDQPDTAGLAAYVDETGAIDTKVKLLTAVYVPNIRPTRAWRSNPVACHMGRSDFAGVEPLMDALDETYTSWMRDLRLGKARLLVPESYLELPGRGQGARFDGEREVFAALNVLGSPTGEMQISSQQFAIRVQEHADTAAALVERIVSGAGYSAQTFGAMGDVAVTATEVHARERRSFTTRSKKARYWRAGLAQILEVLLAVDRAVFSSQVTPDRPDVEFPDTVEEQPLTMAQTAQALRQAEAASTETLVRMTSPEMDDSEVAAEVSKIHAESGRAVPDPSAPPLPAA